jgi:hypothetical protein
MRRTAHRSRRTGTMVQIADNRDGSVDSTDGQPWYTICLDHGGLCSHETLALARSWAPLPDQWCPDCQEQ